MSTNSKLNENRWNRNYEDVLAYMSEHCCDINGIPDDALNRSGKNLKRWIYEMTKSLEGRSRYTLSEQQIQLLDQIGIRDFMSASMQDWFAHFGDLLAFYHSNHHVHIPEDALCSDGNSLRTWLKAQRRRYRQRKLPQKCIDAFMENGIMEALESPLDIAMQHMEEYYQAHGNVDFPLDYVCPDGYQLGIWLRSFRDRYLKEKNQTPYPKEVIDRLNEMGVIWNKPDMIWQQNFDQCKEYLDTHEGYRIPIDLLTQSGTYLQSWIKNNRKKYVSGKLSPEKRRLLESIQIMDITFYDPSTETWQQKFEQCKAYLDAHEGYRIPNSLTSDNGTNLRLWLIRCRNQYQNGLLPKDSMCLLDSIHIMDITFYDPNVETWQQKFEQCKAYLDAHESDRIPNSLTSDSGTNLHLWLIRCKEQYLNGKLSKEKMRLLDSIRIMDITFYDSDADVWRQKFNQIKSYLDTHGGNWLPIDLQAEDGTYFRSWIKYSRRRYADGKLTPEKRQLLESIHIMDITFRGTKDEIWYENFEQCKAFLDAHGGYWLPAAMQSKSGTSLRFWIEGNRKNYVNGKLTEERMKLLESIHIMEIRFYGARDEKWRRIFDKCKAYLDTHEGHRIPNHLQAEDGTDLRNWIYHNRKKYIDGQLAEYQATLLESICIMDITFLSEDSETFLKIWHRNYRQCKAFLETHEGCWLPSDLLTEDGKSLQAWILHNRSQYKKGRLTQEKRRLLESIHIMEITFRSTKADTAALKRTKTITLNLSDAEYEQVRNMAADAGFHRLATYVRCALLGTDEQ